MPSSHSKVSLIRTYPNLETQAPTFTHASFYFATQEQPLTTMKLHTAIIIIPEACIALWTTAVPGHVEYGVAPKEEGPST